MIYIYIHYCDEGYLNVIYINIHYCDKGYLNVIYIYIFIIVIKGT